jgi:transcriptional regulator with XRE-family HTH domain
MLNPGPLAHFLRAKRAELEPQRTALSTYGARRRVHGLRREEVAQLAGISIGYYTRLEQGHSRHASDEVLLALANALQLTVTETEHLLDLSRARTAVTGPVAPPVEVAGEAALAMLGFITDRPAVLLGRRNDVLGWNRLGHALIAPHLPFSAPTFPGGRPSMARMLFLDPGARALYRDWNDEARDYVAYLRMISGRYPDDTALASLVGELLIKDADFAALWAEGRVGECIAGTKRLRHPAAGDITVSFQLWAQAGCPEHRIEIYDPADASRVLPALARVSRIAAGD